MTTETKLLRSEQEVEAYGIRLGREARPGQVIALTGDLGAGKTTLTKAIARGLGISETVTSPTFTIVKEYRSGRLPLFHFDVYRIGDVEEMYELGYEEYFFGDGVCVVEWADLIDELIPEDALRISIAYGQNEEERIYTCTY
ncbi:MAG: tRNA (adenosine(37)-N6)-threonylcarbamoyltransferase complex ATPase subunit type 1 TsaE [Firmicutes bacterium]|nr:tRNA (adenosine(37)-N6)-threonylcarbamoyltransferase complex ATPase subunit type 1 TsaE [Bacillota bacterium]